MFNVLLFLWEAKSWASCIKMSACVLPLVTSKLSTSHNLSHRSDLIGHSNFENYLTVTYSQY